jgi:hypothetical protein
MRVDAAERLSGCHCADLKSLCPRHPVDIMFDVTGIRYDPSSCEFFLSRTAAQMQRIRLTRTFPRSPPPAPVLADWLTVCEPYACGRYVQTEAEYRAARKACGQSLDGASVVSPDVAVVAIAALAGLNAAGAF